MSANQLPFQGIQITFYPLPQRGPVLKIIEIKGKIFFGSGPDLFLFAHIHCHLDIFMELKLTSSVSLPSHQRLSSLFKSISRIREDLNPVSFPIS